MKSITCIVESPKGSAGKFDFDPSSGYFKLGKTLPAGLVFPFDFGFIPGTLGEDGDPLDVIVISETQTFTGCALDCRIIGGITARQTERDGDTVRNDRFIVVPEISVMYGEVEKLSQFPKQIMQEIERFFINYNDQAGKRFRPLQLLQADPAIKLIQNAQENAEPTQLVQLLLPQSGRDGKPFPERYYSAVRKKLTEKFGGVTIYSQAPATGLWKADEEHVETDRLIIFEVMVSCIDKAFWTRYKESLQKTFSQQEIAIRRSEIGLL